MYPVSEAFLRAVQENVRKYYWTGKITTKNRAVYCFGPKDIVKGSGYISSQCCGSTEIELGTVYAAEMGITLLTDIDRYTLEDAKVELFYHLKLADGSYETVPMGIFEVTEANRTVKCLELKAYDYMLRFDKSFNGFETVGRAYDFIHLCCEACHVKFALSQADIEAMPNGKEGLSIYTDNDIETYRDVLYYVGQVLGGFFCINREGVLELRKYGTDPVMEIGRKHRFSSSFSDFITRYTAISSTNKTTEIAEYYHLENDNALTMNLGVNPLLQFGLEETRRQLCTNILNDISVINYVPFDSDTIGNPALDIGDVLIFAGGQADESQISAITSMQVNMYGKHRLKGVGKNPRLAQAKSKHDKNISGLLSQIEAGKIGIHTFTNASSFTVGKQNVRIISIDFATSEENHVQFFGEVVVDINADPVTKKVTASGSVNLPVEDIKRVIGNDSEEESGGLDGTENEGARAEIDVSNHDTELTITLPVELPVNWSEDGSAVVTFTYELNNEVITIHQPVETWSSGKHTILLYYPIEKVIANFTNTFNVYMNVRGGTGSIDTGYCVASVSGQSMGASDAWDGKIEAEDFVPRFAVGTGRHMHSLKGVGFTDKCDFKAEESGKMEYADKLHGRSHVGGFGRMVVI